jgi:hypothetical protein
VAAEAIRRNTCEFPSRVTLLAGNRDVRTGKWKTGIDVMVEAAG